MKNAVLAFLARDWAGLAIAVLVAFAGAAVLAAPYGAPIGRVAVGVALLATAAILGGGAIYHLAHLARIHAAHPPPGRMIDMGGYRVHIFAEGESKGGPSIVWFPGAHSAAFELHHLHRALRSQTRSILIDRPGTGWSDAGPFPRRTALEAVEVVKALDLAGEAGPFIWVGHSFGGLLAANIARRHPELTAAVVLLDATPCDTIIYGPRLGNLKAMSRDALLGALRRLFGLHNDRAAAQQRNDPIYGALIKRIDEVLGPDVLPARALAVKSGLGCASASIYRELTPEGMASVAWDTAVYEGDLDDLLVLLVAPGDSPEIADLPEVARVPDPEARRMMRFFPLTRERYMTTSSRARRVIAPAGSGHNFPFEAPEFTIDIIKSVLTELKPENS